MNRQTRPTGYAYLLTLEGHRCIASNHYGDAGLSWSNTWGWIADSIAHEFECNADDVSVLETDDGDQFTIEGKPVAYLASEKPAPVAHLMAAE